jgi:hypothetical protein
MVFPGLISQLNSLASKVYAMVLLVGFMMKTFKEMID